MPENDREKAREDAISQLIHALKHPLRRRILKALMRGPVSASALSKEFEVQLSSVSYHLAKVLKQCGALLVVEQVPRRGVTETVYRLKPSFFLEVIDWPAIPEPLRSGLRGLALHDFLEAAIASLETDAASTKKSNHPRKDNCYYLYLPVSADEDGQHEINAAADEFKKRVAAVEARCAVLDPADLISLIVGVASFEAAPLPMRGRKK